MHIHSGQKVDLTISGESEIKICLGWDTDNRDIEIDGAAFLLSERGICENDEDFICNSQPISRQQAVIHAERGGQDKEVITIKPALIPKDIHRIVITLSIYEGEARQHFFSQIVRPFLRIITEDRQEEWLRFDFGQGMASKTAVVIGELYQQQGVWMFRTIAEGLNGGLIGICNYFGMEVMEEIVPKPIRLAEVIYLAKIRSHRQPSIHLSHATTSKGRILRETN
ncbi:General stress protein 16U [compost metagenome]